MDISDLSLHLFALLFIVAVVAGFLDTLAGGGGLITLPALIVSGVPPLLALGTNKLQSSMGTATATLMMLKTKRIQWHEVKLLMFMAFIGSILGSVAVQFINPKMLSFVIPVVLVFIATYFILSPKPKAEASAKMSVKQYRNSLVPGVGFYDGMFGPGTGSFFALIGVSCRGQSLLESTATAKSLNFATNFASFLVFLLAGKIVWTIGLLMMVGQALGAWLGSHCLIKINPIYLRAIVVTMCLGMLVKYSESMGWLTFI